MTERERERYLRQMALPGWGEEAQERLASCTVFVAGAGGLGSAALLYLAAAGVGCIRVCDAGRVELSNLNRQVLHSERRLHALKASSARRTIAAFAPRVRVVPLAATLEEGNAGALAAGAAVLLDCLDNIPGRLALNRHAVRTGTPLVHAGVGGLGGQFTVVHPPHTACLACFLPDGPWAASPAVPLPVVGAAAGVLGCLQAMEAIKLITGIGECAKNRIVFWDGETMSFDEVSIRRAPDCPACGGAGA